MSSFKCIRKVEDWAMNEKMNITTGASLHWRGLSASLINCFLLCLLLYLFSNFKIQMLPYFTYSAAIKRTPRSLLMYCCTPWERMSWNRWKAVSGRKSQLQQMFLCWSVRPSVRTGFLSNWAQLLCSSQLHWVDPRQLTWASNSQSDLVC